MSGQPDAEVRRVLLTEGLAWRVVLMALFPPLLLFTDRLQVRIPMSRSSFRRMRIAQWLTMPVLVGGHLIGLMALLTLPWQPWALLVGYVPLLVLLWLYYSRFHTPVVPTIDLAGDNVVLLTIPNETVADGIRSWLDAKTLPEDIAEELADIRELED